MYCGRNTTAVITVKVDYCASKTLIKGLLVSINYQTEPRPKPYLADHKPFLERYLIGCPTAKLQDLCSLIKRQVGIKVGRSQMSRVVKKLGLPYKKIGNQGRVRKKAISQPN